MLERCIRLHQRPGFGGQRMGPGRLRIKTDLGKEILQDAKLEDIMYIQYMDMVCE